MNTPTLIRNSDTGVSILEVLAVLSLISIVALASVPVSFSEHERSLLESDAQKLQSLIKRALSISMESEQNTRIESALAGDALYLIDTSDRRLAKVLLSKPVKASRHGEAFTIHISPRGTVSPMTISLTTQCCTCMVTLSLHGRLRGECL